MIPIKKLPSFFATIRDLPLMESRECDKHANRDQLHVNGWLLSIHIHQFLCSFTILKNVNFILRHEHHQYTNLLLSNFWIDWITRSTQRGPVSAVLCPLSKETSSKSQLSAMDTSAYHLTIHGLKGSARLGRSFPILNTHSSGLASLQGESCAKSSDSGICGQTIHCSSWLYFTLSSPTYVLVQF